LPPPPSPPPPSPPPPSPPPPSPPPPPARRHVYSGSADDNPTDPRFPDCDLADWICNSGANSTAPDEYLVAIELVCKGRLEQYNDRVLKQVVNEVMAIASVPSQHITIVVTQSTQPVSRLNITIGAEDELRARKIVESFGDSLATAATAEALFGLPVTAKPVAYILDINGQTVVSAASVATGAAGAGEHDYRFGGEPVRFGWILFAVLGGISLTVVIFCIRGLGGMRLRQMEPMDMAQKHAMSESHFFTIVDARASR